MQPQPPFNATTISDITINENYQKVMQNNKEISQYTPDEYKTKLNTPEFQQTIFELAVENINFLYQPKEIISEDIKINFKEEAKKLFKNLLENNCEIYLNAIYLNLAIIAIYEENGNEALNFYNKINSQQFKEEWFNYCDNNIKLGDHSTINQATIIFKLFTHDPQYRDKSFFRLAFSSEDHIKSLAYYNNITTKDETTEYHIANRKRLVSFDENFKDEETKIRYKQEAIQTFEKISESSDDNLKLLSYFELGDIYIREKQTIEQAADCCTKAINYIHNFNKYITGPIEDFSLLPVLNDLLKQLENVQNPSEQIIAVKEKIRKFIQRASFKPKEYIGETTCLTFEEFLNAFLNEEQNAIALWYNYENINPCSTKDENEKILHKNNINHEINLNRIQEDWDDINIDIIKDSLRQNSNFKTTAQSGILFKIAYHFYKYTDKAFNKDKLQDVYNEAHKLGTEENLINIGDTLQKYSLDGSIYYRSANTYSNNIKTQSKVGSLCFKLLNYSSLLGHIEYHLYSDCYRSALYEFNKIKKDSYYVNITKKEFQELIFGLATTQFHLFLSKVGYPTEKIKLKKEALQIFNDLLEHCKDINILNNIYLTLALIEIAEDNSDKALAYYSKSTKYSKKHLFGTAKEIFTKSAPSKLFKDCLLAELIFKLLEHDPKYKDEIYFLRGLDEANNKNYSKAISHYNKMEYKDNTAEYNIALCKLQWILNQPYSLSTKTKEDYKENILETFTYLSETDTELKSDSYYQLGNFYAEETDLEKAIDFYIKSFLKNSKNNSPLIKSKELLEELKKEENPSEKTIYLKEKLTKFLENPYESQSLIEHPQNNILGKSNDNTAPIESTQTQDLKASDNTSPVKISENKVLDKMTNTASIKPPIDSTQVNLSKEFNNNTSSTPSQNKVAENLDNQPLIESPQNNVHEDFNGIFPTKPVQTQDSKAADNPSSTEPLQPNVLKDINSTSKKPAIESKQNNSLEKRGNISTPENFQNPELQNSLVSSPNETIHPNITPTKLNLSPKSATKENLGSESNKQNNIGDPKRNIDTPNSKKFLQQQNHRFKKIGGGALMVFGIAAGIGSLALVFMHLIIPIIAIAAILVSVASAISGYKIFSFYNDNKEKNNESKIPNLPKP